MVVLITNRSNFRVCADVWPASRSRVAFALLLCFVPLALFSGGCATPGTGAAAQNARGVERFSAGEYDEAIALFQESIAENPDSAETYYNLGSAYQRKAAATGDYTLLTKAEDSYWTALQSNPAPETIVCCYRGLATSATARGDSDGAMRILEEWSERNPDSIEPKLEIAYLMEAQERPDEAYEKLQEVAQLAPGDYRPLYKMSVLSERAGDFEEAVAQANAAAQLSPNNEDVVQRAREARTQYAISQRTNKATDSAEDASQGQEEQLAVAAGPSSVSAEVATTAAQAESGTSDEPPTQLMLPADSGDVSTTPGSEPSGSEMNAVPEAIPLSKSNAGALGFGEVVAYERDSSGATVEQSPFASRESDSNRKLSDDSDVKWISSPNAISQTTATVPATTSRSASISQPAVVEPKKSPATAPVFAPVESAGTSGQTGPASGAQTKAAAAQPVAIAQRPSAKKTFKELKAERQERARQELSTFSDGPPSMRAGAFF